MTVNFNARGHEATIVAGMERAEQHLAQVPAARRLFAQAVDALNSITTDMRGRQTGVAGSYAPGLRRISLSTRRHNIDDIESRLAAHRQYNDDFRAWRTDQIDNGAAATVPRPERPNLPKARRENADPDAIASTWIHELTHVVDITGADAALTRLAQSDGIFDRVRDLYDNGRNIDHQRLWYAASQPVEVITELVRMYVMGDAGTPIEGTRMTAAQWRQAYPDLARWVETRFLALGE